MTQYDAVQTAERIAGLLEDIARALLDGTDREYLAGMLRSHAHQIRQGGRRPRTRPRNSPPARTTWVGVEG